MSIIAEQADLRLNSMHTIEQLNDQINDLDVSGSRSTTTLFSGENTRDIVESLSLVAPGEGLRLIGDTEAAEFLDDNPLLNEKLRELFENSDPDVIGSEAYQYLNGIAEYYDGQGGDHLIGGTFDGFEELYGEKLHRDNVKWLPINHL